MIKPSGFFPMNDVDGVMFEDNGRLVLPILKTDKKSIKFLENTKKINTLLPFRCARGVPFRGTFQ